MAHEENGQIIVDWLYIAKTKLILILVILLSSCAGGSGTYTGDSDSGPAMYETCKNGVVYYVRGQGIAPAFMPDGALYTCDQKK